MLAVVLGLSVAACAGLSDVAAGVAARRLSPVLAGFWTQSIGVLVGGLLLLLLQPTPAPGQLAWGLVAGLVTGTSLALLYRAMALGPISLVVPIAACSVVFPVIVGLAQGETLPPVAKLGIPTVIAGMVLATYHSPSPPDGSRPVSFPAQRRAVGLAIASAVASGVFLILIDFSPMGQSCWSPLWTAAAARMGSLGVQVGLVLLGPRHLALPEGAIVPVAAAGVLSQLSLILLGAGAMTGAYCVVTGLLGLYPVIAVLVGVFVLGERLTMIQTGGVGLAVIGVLLVSRL